MPHGYRVRWASIQPPGTAPAKLLESLEPAPSLRISRVGDLTRRVRAGISLGRGLRRASELPIGAVLRNLREQECRVAEGGTLARARFGHGLDQDFMENESEEQDLRAWLTTPPPPPPAPTPPPSPPTSVGDDAEPECTDEVCGKEPNVGAQVMDGAASVEAPTDHIGDEPAPGGVALDSDGVQVRAVDHVRLVHWPLMLVGAAAVAAATIIALLLSILLADGPPEAGQDPFDAAPAPPTRIGIAYVTASILECRSAPAREAASMRRLARGTRLEVLSLDGDWVSVSHGDRQCWVAARYLSVQEPL